MVIKYKYTNKVLMVVPLRTKVFWQVMLCQRTNHLVTWHHITKGLNPTYRFDTPSLNFSFRMELHCSSASSICTFALNCLNSKFIAQHVLCHHFTTSFTSLSIIIMCLFSLPSSTISPHLCMRHDGGGAMFVKRTGNTLIHHTATT